jgi:hypothetical protein
MDYGLVAATRWETHRHKRGLRSGPRSEIGAARILYIRTVTKENMADEEIQAELARLRAENESLKQKRNTTVSMKVSEKGAVSVYGLGRFPVTLYQEQWQKLLALSDDIKAFIEENRSKLKVKE